MSEAPFKIEVSNEQLDILHKKLALAVFPDEHEDAPRGINHSVPLADIQRLVSYWKDGFDWRKAETQLNAELPQFTRDIQVEGFGALNIHYVHQKSEVVDAIPLLFVHGWPGNFMEVRKMLPMLTEGSPDHPSFHVVALSLPGFGFSAAPNKTGFGIAKYAEVGHKLMLALGYNEYVTQGGDWGSMIARKIARLYGGEHCKAWHTNLPQGSPPRPLSQPFSLLALVLGWISPADKEALDRTKWYQKFGSEYFTVQSTRPQTLGYSLADSPVGLLGWIYEKLSIWTDHYPWTDDEVLTWISIYWFSRAGPTASLRIYYEAVQENPELLASSETTTIPLGFSHFPKEIIKFPRKWSRARNLVFEAEHESGGHFAAWEKPDLLAGDLRKMFGKGGPAFGVVPGKTGYA